MIVGGILIAPAGNAERKKKKDQRFGSLDIMVFIGGGRGGGEEQEERWVVDWRLKCLTHLDI